MVIITCFLPLPASPLISVTPLLNIPPPVAVQQQEEHKNYQILSLLEQVC